MAKQVNASSEYVNKTKKPHLSRNNIVLLEACCNGKLNYIKSSIDSGADVHCFNEDNEFPLLKCCYLSPGEAEKCIKYLLKRGANANLQDKYGRTALSHMAEKGMEQIVDILLSKCDGDPTIEDVKGNTALMYAVKSGNADIVANFIGYFLAIRYPIDKRNMVGLTPLLLAAKLGILECAKVLVELGEANLRLRDLDNFKSSIDWIRDNCPENVPEFVAMDPVRNKKQECAIRRRSGPKLRPRYRILSDFFPDGKIPSCWRSSCKNSQEIQRHLINRTICIVSEEDDDTGNRSLEPELMKLIDSPTPYASSSPALSVTSSSAPLLPHPPRSMFDIPHLTELRAAADTGCFMDGSSESRCNSALSTMSAPTPDVFQVFRATHRKMERRKSIDNSLLTRVLPNKVVPTPSETKQTTEVLMVPKKPHFQPPISPVIFKSEDVLRRVSEPKKRIAPQNPKTRKSSLPSITKNPHIVTALYY